MNCNDIGDLGVARQQLINLFRHRRLIVALVELQKIAPQNLKCFGGALPIGPVHEHQRPPVFRNKTGQHGLDTIGAAAPKRYAVIGAFFLSYRFAV